MVLKLSNVFSMLLLLLKLFAEWVVFIKQWGIQYPAQRRDDESLMLQNSAVSKNLSFHFVITMDIWSSAMSFIYNKIILIKLFDLHIWICEEVSITLLLFFDRIALNLLDTNQLGKCPLVVFINHIWRIAYTKKFNPLQHLTKVNLSHMFLTSRWLRAETQIFLQVRFRLVEVVSSETILMDLIQELISGSRLL